MDEDGLLTIGKITGVHGLGGNLKVHSFAESRKIFSIGMQVRLKRPDQGSADSLGKAFTITRSSPMKKGLLLGLKEVDSRQMAEELVGHDILIPKDSLPELDDDTWYWNDLYGLDVTDKVYGHLGGVDSILPTGAHDVLVIKDKETGRETLIPMHRRFVASVDLKHKVIRTTLPEGYCS